MALLNDTRRLAPSPPTLAGATLVAIAGCSLVGALRERVAGPGPAFSHRIHVEEEGLDCETCHATVYAEDTPGMPVARQCRLCHPAPEPPAEGEEPAEEEADVLAPLLDGEGALRLQGVTRLAEDVTFPHLRHVDTGVECGACHAGIETNERVDRGLALSMDDCLACHEKLGQDTECATCHAALATDVAPRTHGELWKREHGGVVRSRSAATVDRCELCHQESSCVSCHLDEPPADHTNYWRRRGHGLVARMDRERCSACHRSDTCDRCHSETEPLSHHGAWGGTQSNHCLSCHFPLEAEGCGTCHASAPSHALAPPKPPDHTPGMNCLACHGNGQPLPHAQKGDDCNICHL